MRIYEMAVVPFLNQLGIGTLDEFPDEVLNAWKYKWKFDAIYVMGVWERSQISYSEDEARWLRLFGSNAPWKKSDIGMSPFAIRKYTVSWEVGGTKALKRFKKRLNARGLKLILDFVPNHLAWDHLAVSRNPGWFVQNELGDICPGAASKNEIWPEVAQLDYTHPKMRKLMLKTIRKRRKLCDGFRCDMAHLVMNRIFDANWPEDQTFWRASELPEFWSQVRKAVGKKFYLLAEAYGHTEYELIQMGFDAVYDKEDGFYDRLKGVLVDKNGADLEGHIRGCNENILSDGTSYGSHLLRFLENHDEMRAREVFGNSLQEALGRMFDSSEGDIMIHNGQLVGAKQKTPVMLNKFIEERPVKKILSLYEKYLECPKHWRDYVPKKFQKIRREISVGWLPARD